MQRQHQRPDSVEERVCSIPLLPYSLLDSLLLAHTHFREEPRQGSEDTRHAQCMNRGRERGMREESGRETRRGAEERCEMGSRSWSDISLATVQKKISLSSLSPVSQLPQQHSPLQPSTPNQIQHQLQQQQLQQQHMAQMVPYSSPGAKVPLPSQSGKFPPPLPTLSFSKHKWLNILV